MSGVCDPDCEEDGVWLLLSGIDGDWLGAVDGVCCDGVVSGEEDGCCAWLFGVVEGVES